MILNCLDFSCYIFFSFLVFQVNKAAILIEKHTVEVRAEELSTITARNVEAVYNLSQLDLHTLF